MPLFLLSGLVRENNFKVVLTGEGGPTRFSGDTISSKRPKSDGFGGRATSISLAPSAWLNAFIPIIFQNPARGRAFLQKFFSVSEKDLCDPFISHRANVGKIRGRTACFSIIPFLGSWQTSTLLLTSRNEFPADFDKRDIFSRAQWLEMDVFLSNYLLSSQGDRVAMAHSLELRLPFLDYRVMDFAARLPPPLEDAGIEGKIPAEKGFFAARCPTISETGQNNPTVRPLARPFFIAVRRRSAI